MDTKDRLEQIAEDGYDFQFGEYFSKGWQLFSDQAGGFIGYTFLAGMISMIVGLIPFVGSFAGIFVNPVLIAGFLIVAYKLDRNQNVQFGDFFKGFDNIGQLGLTNFIVSLIVLAACVPFFVVAGMSVFELIMNGGLEEDMQVFFETFNWSSLFLLIIPLIVTFLLSWSTYFVALYRLEFMDAIKLSYKIILKNWIMIFLFSIVVSFVMGAGVLLLGVGLLLSVPLGMCCIYAAFADVTDIHDEGEPNLVDELIV